MRVPDTDEKAELLEKIRMPVVEAAADDGPTVRIRAVQLLAHFGDAEAVAIIEGIAKNDPYRAEYMPGEPYSVREAATRVLEEANTQ